MRTHTFEELEGILAPYGQTHLLRFWNQLAPEQRDQLGDQIRSIDWAQVAQWIQAALSEAGATAIPFKRLTPAPYVPLQPETAADATRIQEARAAGEALLRAGSIYINVWESSGSFSMYSMLSAQWTVTFSMPSTFRLCSMRTQSCGSRST